MLHLTFTDGSNPYLFRGDVIRELRRWKRNYTITGYWKSGIFFGTATAKHNLFYA